MLPAFFAQFAAGCLLITALALIQQSGWTYMRLMAAVCLGLEMLAGALLLRETGWPQDLLRRLALAGLGWAAISTIIWLMLNSFERPRISQLQSRIPAVAGIGALLAAVSLSLFRDPLIGETGVQPAAAWKMAMTTMLGAGLLGSVTCAMLLGHRYLTDTDMPIAPLRRLAKIYITVLALRIAWLLFAGHPILTSPLDHRSSDMWFWLMVSVRFGVGVVGVAIFAWMAWDCVKRRATQSATALFYLSMILVFFGELAGQYLSRTQTLAL